MENEKMENLLRLALETPRAEREKSLDLNVGYEPLEQKWTVIVKHTAGLEALAALDDRIVITQLLGGYAIMEIPESLMDTVASRDEIEYMEKPKRLFFSVRKGKQVSCVTQTALPPLSLTGEGVLIGLVDSGIDITHPDFRNADGSTRIVALWDQTIDEVFSEAQLNEILQQEYAQNEVDINLAQREGTSAPVIIRPSRDISGHGTQVAGIAAGNGNASGGQYAGMAPNSRLIVVKLGNPSAEQFPRTTELMTGIDFCVRLAERLRQPLALNLSFGNVYGSHTGTSLLEEYINQAAGYWKNSIVIGAGNEGTASNHTAGRIPKDSHTEVEIKFAVSPYETVLNIQLWKFYGDQIEIRLRSPSGEIIGPFVIQQQALKYRLSDTDILIYYGEPAPYSIYQEIYFDFIPVENYINSGVWSLLLNPGKILSGEYKLWMPARAALNEGTGFLYPTPDTTLTIPSTAEKAICVGAYDAAYLLVADFSGRGYTAWTNQVKPDLVAPGVNVMTTAPGGSYRAASGTSFAAPFVTGAAALLMEWGIVRGNDPYLYGEKIKAYLIKGAKPLPGFDEWPNPQAGWGALCVRDSLPV